MSATDCERSGVAIVAAAIEGLFSDGLSEQASGHRYCMLSDIEEKVALQIILAELHRRAPAISAPIDVSMADRRASIFEHADGLQVIDGEGESHFFPGENFARLKSESVERIRAHPGDYDQPYVDMANHIAGFYCNRAILADVRNDMSD